MRTTVTLDPDAEQIVRKAMAERGVSFKQALNDAIRSTMSEAQPTFRTRTIDMGRPLVDLDRAMQLVGDLEDEELVKKMLRGA